MSEEGKVRQILSSHGISATIISVSSSNNPLPELERRIERQKEQGQVSEGVQCETCVDESGREFVRVNG